MLPDGNHLRASVQFIDKTTAPCGSLLSSGRAHLGRGKTDGSSVELPKPKPLPYDVRAARRLPWGQRVQLACQAWAIQGYGAPGVVYGLYLLKIAAYVGAWWYFCTWSADWSQAQTFTERLWTETAFQKAIFWSMAFEVLGLGCGSGPLTARYWPPFAACLHFARPNTIRLPLFPWLPGTRGDRRTALDATLYLGLLWCLARPLFAQTITPDLIWPVVILQRVVC